MKDEELEKTLQALKGKQLPPCPGNLEANVLRRVRNSESIKENVWSWLDLLIPQKTFIMSAFALAIFTSSVVTAVSVSSYAPESNRRLEVTRALGFETINSSNLLALNEK